MQKQFFLYCIIFIALIPVSFSCQQPDEELTDPPIASFNYSSARSLPFAVTFVNTSAGSAGSTYIWDFGDGSTSNQIQPGTHQYTSYGVYQVKLVEIPAAGPRDSLVQQLNLSNTPGPSGVVFRTGTAAFTYTVANTYTVTFNNTSTYSYNYSWDFGNGNTSTANTPIITNNYNAPGSYRIKLSATGAGGTDTCSTVIVF